MRGLLLLVPLAACGPKGARSTGTLMFDPREPAAADTMLASEAEVLTSATLLAHVKEQFRADVSADAIRVERRGGSMILAVTVRDPDPAHATALCNQVLQTYVDYRLMGVMVPMQEQMAALSEQIDKHPEDLKAKERLEELQLARATPRSDVRVLDPCAIPK